MVKLLFSVLHQLCLIVKHTLLLRFKKCDNWCDCNVMFTLGSLFSWRTQSEFFLANSIETAMINCSSQDDSDSSIWCKYKVEKQRKIYNVLFSLALFFNTTARFVFSTLSVSENVKTRICQRWKTRLNFSIFSQSPG